MFLEVYIFKKVEIRRFRWWMIKKLCDRQYVSSTRTFYAYDLRSEPENSFLNLRQVTLYGYKEKHYLS